MHQFLVYGSINMLSKNITTIKKNKQALLEDSREVGLEIYTEKTEYMVTFHHQNAGQNHNFW
jgi:hypothetical protein